MSFGRTLYLYVYIHEAERDPAASPPEGAWAARPPSAELGRPPTHPGALGEPGGPGDWGSRERQKGLHPSCLTGDTGGDPGLLLIPDRCRASSALGPAALPGARAARGARGVGSPAWRGRAAPGAHQRPRGQSVCISPINGISCPPPPTSSVRPAPRASPAAWTRGRACPAERVRACPPAGVPGPGGAPACLGLLEVAFRAHAVRRGASGAAGDTGRTQAEPPGTFSAPLAAPTGTESPRRSSGPPVQWAPREPSFEPRPSAFPLASLQPSEVADPVGAGV